MKKIFYSVLFVLATSITFSACTEEDVKPKTEFAGGGGVADPI